MSESDGPMDAQAAACELRQADDQPVDRRSFLVWAAGISLGASGFFAVTTAIQAMLPPARSIDGKTKLGKVVVARVEDLESGTPLLTEYGDEPVFVLKTGRGVEVFSAACPHVRCTLRFNPATREFDCPCHGSSFTLDGVRLRGPAPRNMVAADFEISGGDVVVSGFRE